MSIRINYRPSDLAYYTTWWLSSKSSNSSQMTTISGGENSTKSEEEFNVTQQDIHQEELETSCCIPIKKCRNKRT